MQVVLAPGQLLLPNLSAMKVCNLPVLSLFSQIPITKYNYARLSTCRQLLHHVAYLVVFSAGVGWHLQLGGLLHIGMLRGNVAAAVQQISQRSEQGSHVTAQFEFTL